MFLYRPPYLLFLFPFIIRFVFFSSSQNINNDVNLSPLRFPATRNRSILILVVLDAKSDRREYDFPLSTIECYAKQHNYTLLIVKDNDFDCRQRDYMFRRHCVSSIILKESPSIEWLLFLDADIAVANPNRLLEEYLDKKVDLIMYDRFAGWEIAMGSYFARNTPWTRNFMMKFANFESELPGSFHGTDNGAIHSFILRELQPSAMEAARLCFQIWETSTSFDDLFLYEACIRSILGSKQTIGKLRIIPKGRGWVRDGWITQSKWSPQRDFMLHGFKMSDRRIMSRLPFVNSLKRVLSNRFMWFSFLKNDLASECHWEYENELRVSEEAINEKLIWLHRQIQRRYWLTLAQLSSRI